MQGLNSNDLPEKEDIHKFIPLCPKCSLVPEIQFKENNIKLSCLCKFNKTIPLKEYLDLIKSKAAPENCKEETHKSNKIIAFCIDCDRWLCMVCNEEHKSNDSFKKHEILRSYSVPLCSKHNIEQKIYCAKCCQYLCYHCKVNHNKHLNYDLHLMSLSIKIKEIKNDLQNKENKLKESYNKLRDDYINDFINKVNQVYEEGLKKNRLIIELGNILLDDYTDKQINNYQLIKNIKNTTNLLFKEHNNKEEVLTYFLNNNLQSTQLINLDEFKMKKGKLNNLHNLKTIQIITEKEIIFSLLVLNDKRIASCLYNGSIKIYDPFKNYDCTLTIKEHTDVVPHISTMDDNKIISCSADKTIKIWKIEQNNYECLATFEGHTDWVYKAIPLPNHRIGSCSYDKTIKLWSNIRPFQCIQTLTQHKAFVSSLLLMSDNKYLVSCTGEAPNSLIVWNINPFKIENEMKDIGCNIRNSLIEIGENKIAVGYTNYIVIINIIESKVEKSVSSNNGISSLLFLKDRKILAGDEKGMLFVYDKDLYRIQEKKCHDDWINCAVTLNENCIVTCSEDKTIKIWE